MAVPAETRSDLTQVPWRRRYSTNFADLIHEFYIPALEAARTYDRAVGYFRSSLFTLTASTVAAFALRGGKVRMVCAPELTSDDIEGLRKGLSLREVVDNSSLRELESVIQAASGRTNVELFAALIGTGALRIKFAIWKKQAGIFHDKVGIFEDDSGHRVSFSGSINETLFAWHPQGNHESFEVFTSWSVDAPRVADHALYFEQLWRGEIVGLSVFEPSEAFRTRILRTTSTDARERLAEFASQPASSRGRTPKELFRHQQDALEAWHQAHRRGVLEHVTGSGKTVTAIAAIREWLALGKPALVVVPSNLLLEQWGEELRKELAAEEPSLLLAGGGNDRWRHRSLLGLHTAPSGQARVTVATMQTASTDDFLESVSGGPHLLIIADEVHRLGSPKYRAVLGIASGARMGLSATPQRHHDPEGTDEISAYFGDILPTRFSITEAIAAGRLCPYEYFVHLVELTESEVSDYRALTRKIGAAGSSAAQGTDSWLAHLLIQRGRIVKRAAHKAAAAAGVVESSYVPGEHWLVYCDDQQQVSDVRRKLAGQGIESHEYHSQMVGDRGATLDHFRRFGGVLVSIKCLDEGVDIPEITHAVIIASSKNSREFIQRRGRVLRTHPGKHRAVIHDLLISPPEEEREGEFDSMLEGEIVRALEFAKDAANVSTLAFIRGLCIEWGIDPDEEPTVTGSGDAVTGGSDG